MIRLTDAEISRIRSLAAQGVGTVEIARRLGRSKTAVQRNAVRAGIVLKRKSRAWTDEEIALVREMYADHRAEVIASRLGRTITMIYNAAERLGLKKSEAFFESERSARIQRGKQSEAMIASRFPKGHVPANKGLRRPGWAPGRMASTQFRKGSLSGRAAEVVQPIGAERVNKDGYLQRKVNNDLPFQRRWRGVHIIAWESVNGPLPNGHAIVFKNGDKRDFRLDNLECIHRRELMARNTVHRLPKELAQVVQLKGAVQRQINRRTARTIQPTKEQRG